MSMKDLLSKHGSIRKAATAAGMTKSKFMVAYKKELGLCTATTSCQNSCATERTRCAEHLKYAVKTRDPIKKKVYMDQWTEENREYKNSIQRSYQKQNLDKFRQGNKRYLSTPRGLLVNRAKRAKYRASKLQATPSWVNKDSLLEVYESCPQGYHVDHIIPLQNDNVCGLHVDWNLQHLSAFDNDSKANTFDGTYDNLSWKKR